MPLMEQVKAMLTALRIDYLQDLPSYIDGLEQLLLELERTGYEPELCRELYRRIHSLKGSGGTYGLHMLSDICHPLEDLLSNLLEQTEVFQNGFTELGLKYVDLLRKVQIIYQRGGEPGPEIKQALHELRKDASHTLHSALIVESSDVVIAMLKQILTEMHFRVEVVNDGYLALGRLLAEPFEILITNLETKRLNGLALISALQKSGGRTSKTKTVLVTATQLTVQNGGPDFIIRKDASLKEKFKAIVTDIAS
jgi:chemotaxis protein histidine kinase CheA